MAGFSLKDAETIRASLTKQQEDEISLMYRKVYLEVRKQMLAIPKDGTTSQKLQRQYLDKLHQQLDDAYKSLGVGLEKKLKKEAQKAAEGVVDDAKKFTKKAGFEIEGAFSRVPRDIINSIVTGQIYDGSWSLSGAIWADIGKHQSDINRVIAEGLAANKSAYDIARDLEQYVDPKAKKPWDWNKVYPGTAKKVDYNAQRLSRTMISHAYQQSLERVCKKNPFVTGFIWQAAHSNRVCPICEARDGVFFEKGELPLDHPNGMCTFIASMDGDLNAVADRLGDWVQGKDDPALDQWMQDMTGKKMAPKFSELQDKWLKPLGYSTEKMPADFKEFATALDWDKLSELLKVSGASWNDAHPYQKMEKWYNENLKSVRQGVVPINKKTVTAMRAALTSQGVPNKSTWIELIKKQTEDKMLALEEESMKLIGEAGRAGIRVYSGQAYRRMNSYLRLLAQGKTESEAIAESWIDSDKLKAVKDAMKGLDKAKLKTPLVLRRGTDLGDLAGLLPGDFSENMGKLRRMSVKELNEQFQGVVGKYASFTSTSSIWEKGFPGNVEMVLYAPEGTSASSIMTISKYGTDEGETLLNAGTTVRVVSIEESDGHQGSDIRMFLEIIP